MSDSKEVTKDADWASCPSRCYAMTVYGPPSIFNAMDREIIANGTPTEVSAVFRAAMIRSLGIPRWMFDEFSNYSSAKIDARIQTRKSAKQADSFA
jgi:hypothetical protein